MGIYDEQNREWSTNRRFLGDVRKAKSFIKLGDKIVEKVKGNLDLGANLGHGVRDRFIVDDDTTIDVHVQEGVTNPMATVTITAGSLNVPEEQGEEFVGALPLCPDLPHGRPGARMFTQLLGHQRGDTDSGYDEREILDFATMNDPDGFCDDPGDDSRPVFEFPRPFNFAGEEVTHGYLNQWDVFLHGPSSLYANVFATGAPCDFGGGVSGINRDSDEGCRIGLGHGGGCSITNPNTSFSNTHIRTITGVAGIAGIDLVTGEPTSIQREFVAFNWDYTVINPTGQSGPLCNCTAGSHGAGEVGELEIVFIYIEDEDQKAGSACQMAVGIFFGGSDGRQPWLFRDWLGINISGDDSRNLLDNVVTDQWHGPAMCAEWPWALIQFGRFPNPWYAMMTGTDGRVSAYLGDGGVRGAHSGNEGGLYGSDNSAQSWYNSRNVWWYLDSEGFPIEGQGGTNDGTPHMVFN
jgi:hypothetical protein